MISLKTDSRITTHQPTQVLSIGAGGREITVVKTAFYSEPEKIAQAQLARVLMGRASRIAGGKMLVEGAGFEAWDRLTDEQAQDFKSAASIMMGQMGAETHAKALALKRGVEWGSLDLRLAGRAEMVSAATSELGHLGAESHAKVLALPRKRGVEWGSLDKAGQAEMVSAAMSKLGHEHRHLGAEAHAKALALTRGVEWKLLDKAGRAQMVSAAMSEHGHLGAEAHAKALALTRGVEWELLDKAVRAEMVSAAMSEHGGAASRLGTAKKRTEGIEACAQKIAHSEGKNWGSLWTLTKESYRDEAETVCQNCYVEGSAPQA